MPASVPHPPLLGAKALVVGVANDSSIAYGCAKAFRELGAEVAITYQSEKARPHVEPLARMAADRTTRGTLGSMLAAVVMVLLVSCANAANRSRCCGRPRVRSTVASASAYRSTTRGCRRCRSRSTSRGGSG